MKVADGVYFIEGQDEFIPDSHVYLIGDASDSGITLVDAGLMGKGNYKLSAIEAAGIDPASIKRVIMTHTHLDHIGCLPEILEAIPGAELWVHEEEGNPA